MLQTDFTPEEIRQAISDELAEPKYRLGRSWWSQVLEWLQEAWVRFVEWAIRVSEYVGGPVVLGIIVAAVIVVLAAVVTTNLGRRRARMIDDRLRREHEASRGLDPDELEHQAEAAEAEGRFESALRLLFLAGLIRLDRAGLIDLRPGTTSGLVAASVSSAGFAQLVRRFDLVVYGGKAATPDDPILARRVLKGALASARQQVDR